MTSDDLGLTGTGEYQAFTDACNRLRAVGRLEGLCYQPCADSTLPETVKAESTPLPPLECGTWRVFVCGYYAPEHMFQGDGGLLIM